MLNKQEELLLDLIETIEDPIIKAQKLTLFHQALVKETSKPALKIQQPKVDLEQIYNRFTQSKKEVTVNDLQKEIKENKSEVRTLKQEFTILRVDYDLLNRRIQLLENTSHQSNEEGPSDEEVDQTVNPTASLIQEPSKDLFLETISRVNGFSFSPVFLRTKFLT